MRCGVRQVWGERGRASTGGVWEVFRRPIVVDGVAPPPELCAFLVLSELVSAFQRHIRFVAR